MKKVMMAIALCLVCATMTVNAQQTTDVKCGQTVRLKATPVAGYEFLHWQDDESNTNPEREVEISADTELTNFVAIFDLKTYTISATVNDSDMGSVDYASQTGTMTNTVTFTATPSNKCYVFDHWEDVDGNKLSEDATYTYRIGTADATITAVFKEATLTVSASATNGTVTIEIVGAE